MNKFTVGCIWDGSDYYPAKYVNVLYNSVKRNTTIPFDFILYAGAYAKNHPDLKALDKNIRVIHNNFKQWWGGMLWWQAKPEGVETDTVLYIDLDVVIVGNLDPIVNFPSDHAYMKDYPVDMCPRGKENDGNCSVALIRNGAGSRVWEEYEKAGMPQWDVLDPPAGRLFPLGAQGIMNDYKIKHDLFPQDWVPSYKLDVAKRGVQPDCIAISFHGRPKPHELLYVPFIKENWR